MQPRELENLFLAYRERGDAAALAEVFDRSAPELYELARRLAPERSAAEDLVQDTFLVAIEKRAQWDERAALMPWLIGILALGARQRRRLVARRPDPQRCERTEPASPDEELAAEEERERILAAVAALRPEDRSLVEQRVLEGWSPGAIAREQGLAPTTLRMRLSRALARLRRQALSGGLPALVAWSERRAALRAVRLRLVPDAAPPAGSLAYPVTLLGASVLAGVLVIVSCLGPRYREDTPGATAELAAEAHAQAPSARATAHSDPAAPAPLATLGLPPAEGEFVAPLTTPGMPRKRVHFRVECEGHPLAQALLVRVFSDGGYEGLHPPTDPQGRLDVDIVEQGALALRFEAEGTRPAEFRLVPSELRDGEERSIRLEPGPRRVPVRFVAEQPFPSGFAAAFIPLGLLGDRRPSPDEMLQEFLGLLGQPDSILVGIRPDGSANVEILPGRYWVWAPAGNQVDTAAPALLPCCFEAEIPPGQPCDLRYSAALGGVLLVDVLGPATAGMDVSVTLDDGDGRPRRLWFGKQGWKGQAVNIGTLGVRSEALPPGDHTLVFSQRGKEFERRRVTIPRNGELVLSIRP